VTFHSFRVFITTIAASAITVSVAPGLTVKSSIPDVKVDGLKNLKVTTTVSNTSDEVPKFLNDPREVLNSFPENGFSDTNTIGSRPLFNGAKVSHASSLLEFCTHVPCLRF
jgi:hypothetical protein